ncbi:MAG: cyclic nucleotide-binding domain-containing protein [Pseudomonadota bacterium]
MNPQPVPQETLARLQPLAGLAPESFRQAVVLARREIWQRSPHGLDFPWAQRVVYLLKGELKLDYPDGSMKVLVGGCDETAIPLARAGMNPVGARAITDVDLLWFDEKALDILVTWDQLVQPPAETEIGASDAADWRVMSGIFDVRALTLGAFANLPAAHIESLLACFRRQSVKAGAIIVRQGDPGDYYYVIERGRAVVTREVAGACRELAELGAGDVFGEEALVAETTRNATVAMKTDGELLRLDGADFIRLLREPLLQRIDAAEAARRVAAGAVWLDVRFPAEYRQDGLPGAVNIPLNELRDALPSLRRDIEYIAYCQSGRRSSAAAFLMSQRGLHASLLEGGLKSMVTMEKIAA